MPDYSRYYFQNDRIRLRLPEPEDMPYLYESYIDSEAMALEMEGITLVGPKNPPAPVNHVNNACPAFTIETLEGDYVGNIQFNFINERQGTFSLGIFLIREQRGKGYGQDAMAMLLEYGFNERRLHKFEGYCLGENAPSAHMMTSLGCVQEGCVRETIYLHGTYHDRLLFGITEDEWRAKKGAWHHKQQK